MRQSSVAAPMHIMLYHAHVHMYMYIYIYIRIRMCIHTYLHIHMFIQILHYIIHMSICMYIYMCIYTYTHKYLTWNGKAANSWFAWKCCHHCQCPHCTLHNRLPEICVSQSRSKYSHNKPKHHLQKGWVEAKPSPTSLEDSYLVCINAWGILCLGVQVLIFFVCCLA